LGLVIFPVLLSCCSKPENRRNVVVSTIAQRIFGKIADRLKAPEFLDAYVRRPEDFFATSEVGSARRRRDDLKSDRPYDSG
jgi:hypothetical protein